MPYTISVPLLLQNIIFSSPQTVGNYARVNSSGTGLTIESNITYYVNSQLNSDPNIVYHFDFSQCTYSGSNIATIPDQSVNGYNAVSITNVAKSSSTIASKYFATMTNASNCYFGIPSAMPSSGSSFMLFFLIEFSSSPPSGNGSRSTRGTKAKR